MASTIQARVEIIASVVQSLDYLAGQAWTDHEVNAVKWALTQLCDDMDGLDKRLDDWAKGGGGCIRYNDTMIQGG